MTASSPDTRKGVVVRALMEAEGAYLAVGRIAELAFARTDAAALNSARSLVNEIRSQLRMNGAAASVLSTGTGEALSYAWSSGSVEAPMEAAAPVITGGITLPAIAGFTSCIFDGDSLVLDGKKQPRVRER